MIRVESSSPFSSPSSHGEPLSQPSSIPQIQVIAASTISAAPPPSGNQTCSGWFWSSWLGRLISWLLACCGCCAEDKPGETHPAVSPLANPLPTGPSIEHTAVLLPTNIPVVSQDYSSFLPSDSHEVTSLESSLHTLTFILGKPEENRKIVLHMESDITNVESAFIVNAANPQMLGGSGVDGSITKAGGQELHMWRLLTLPDGDGIRCPTGEARLTDAGNLPATFCIHAVGPQGTVPALLKSAYTNALQAAQSQIEIVLNSNPLNLPIPAYPPNISQAIFENALTQRQAKWGALKNRLNKGEPLSISFPTISTGIYGFDRKLAASIAMKAIFDFVKENPNSPLKVFRFVFIRGQEDLTYYKKLLQDKEKLQNTLILKK